MTLVTRPRRSPFRILSLFALSLAVLSACDKGAPTKTPEKAELGPEVPQATLGELAPGEPSTPLPVEADDARLGDATAAVTIIGFLDFQCSFCAQGFQTLMQLQKEYSSSQLRVVFKHLPLDFHEMALPSAIAGQAVMQSEGSDAFFEYAKAAFSRQSELSYENLAKFAEAAGVPRQKYNDLVGQEETFQRVIQDARLAAQSGVDGTPAFFVNGRLISGAQPIEFFKQVIGEELTKVKKAGGDFRSAYQARVTENMRTSVLSALLSSDPEDYRVPIDDSPVLGPKDAPVTLVMFTDFECPYCKRAEVTLGLLKKKYGSKLRIVFKHLPLPFHERARPAALLAAAVQKEKGDIAFFSIAEKIFQSSPDLSERTLTKIGQDHGLSTERLEAIFKDTDAQLADRIQRDGDLAEDILARGTPHFFINGKRLSGAAPIEQFEALIDYGLRRAEELEESGTKAVDIYATLQKSATSPGIPTRLEEDVSLGDGPSRGAAKSPITLHVFSDFQCPYCKQGELLISELEAEYEGQLRVVWHDFPLEFHPAARPAAQAAREAYAQKGATGFWQMHERLFAFDSEKPALSLSEIESHAKSLGMNVEKMRAAVEENRYNEAIDTDIELGQSLGIRGTPAYVLDGYLVTGLKPKRHFQRLIDSVLSEKAEAAPAPAKTPSK